MGSASVALVHLRARCEFGTLFHGELSRTAGQSIRDSVSVYAGEYEPVWSASHSFPPRSLTWPPHNR